MDVSAIERLTDGIFSKALQVRRMIQRDSAELPASAGDGRRTAHSQPDRSPSDRGLWGVRAASSPHWGEQPAD